MIAVGGFIRAADLISFNDFNETSDDYIQHANHGESASSGTDNK